jgi:hypothetical protein
MIGVVFVAVVDAAAAKVKTLQLLDDFDSHYS